MPSLYIDRRTTEMKLDGEVLICYEKGERIATIPLAPIDRLYMKGDINVQASLLAKLGEKGIGVVFLQGRKNEPMMFLPQPHNDAERRISQMRQASDETFCLSLAKNIVLQKAAIQQTFLAKFAKNSAKRMGAVYFAAVAEILPPELGFEGRNRRPPKDPFNASLSLGYTLLYSEATLALYGAGLDPFVGFFHALHFGRKSLACDVMEPIRPMLDEWLVECFAEGVLKVEHFSQMNEGCLLGKEGRVAFYAAFEKVATKWRKIFEKQAYELARLVCNYQPELHLAQFEEFHATHSAILGETLCDI